MLVDFSGFITVSGSGVQSPPGTQHEKWRQAFGSKHQTVQLLVFELKGSEGRCCEPAASGWRREFLPHLDQLEQQIVVMSSVI